MAGELTTRYLYKLFAQIPTATTTWDALIDRLITDTSEMVASYCDRVFTTTTYKEWYDGTGTQRLVLPENPITALYKCCINRNDVLKIQYTSTGLHADVTFDGTSVILHSIDATGTEATSTLAIATYKIASTMATAINLVSGWTAEAQTNFTSTPMILVRKETGLPAKSNDYAMLGAADEDGIEVRIMAGSDRTIERNLDLGSSVYVDGADFVHFPMGSANIFVWYVAGYTLPVDNAGHTTLTTAGNVPGGLTQAVNMVIKTVIGEGKVGGAYKSESLGDYSYTKADTVTGVSSAITLYRNYFNPYMRITI